MYAKAYSANPAMLVLTFAGTSTTSADYEELNRIVVGITDESGLRIGSRFTLDRPPMERRASNAAATSVTPKPRRTALAVALAG